MILDSLEHFNDYLSLNPLFEQVAQFLKKHNLNTMADGTYQIKGDELFVNVTTIKGKSRGEAKLETHNRMLDIQIPLTATETMGYTPRTLLPSQPYNSDNDITFYDNECQQYVDVHPGMFAIFFPSDGHAPCISAESAAKKAIFKVKV